MAQAPNRFPSSTSGFIPQATGQVVSFIRRKDRWKINEYTQLIKTPKVVGAYRKLGNDQPVRVVNPNEFAWADEQDAPSGTHNHLPSTFVPFATQRFAYPFRLGWRLIENVAPDWKILASHSDMAVSQMMTARTKRMLTLLEATATWGSNGTFTAQALDGQNGFFDTAGDDPGDPSTYNFGFRAITAAATKLLLMTNGRVRMDELCLVISPNFARRYAASPEIRSYLARSPFAMAQIRGDAKSNNGMFGLPDMLYGVKVVVEDAVIVTDRPNADGSEATPAPSGTRQFIKSDNSVLLVSRPGKLDGQYGAPSFSTAQIYHYGPEAAVEARDVPHDRLTLGRVVEDVIEIVTTTISGMLVTNVLSS